VALLLVLPHEVAEIGRICISFQIELLMHLDRRGAQILPREREMNDVAETNEELGSVDSPPQYKPSRSLGDVGDLLAHNFALGASGLVLRLFARDRCP